jgi:hypothetical protein
MKYLFSTTKLRTSSKLEAFYTFILKSARRALSPKEFLQVQTEGKQNVQKAGKFNHQEAQIALTGIPRN